LNKLFKVTAISYDGDNKPFVAAYEGRNLPIFGTQFHPEKSSFEWKAHANHHLNSIKIS